VCAVLCNLVKDVANQEKIAEGGGIDSVFLTMVAHMAAVVVHQQGYGLLLNLADQTKLQPQEVLA